MFFKIMSKLKSFLGVLILTLKKSLFKVENAIYYKIVLK